MKKIYVLLIGISFLFGCKEEIKELKPTDKVDLSAYYFPTNDLEEPIVYAYEIVREGEDNNGLFYVVLSSANNNAFFYKYYDQNFELKDSVLYLQDKIGARVGYRYMLFDDVWNRVVFDHNAYFHKNYRTMLDTTHTRLQTMNQYGRHMVNDMKIYFNGFAECETDYYEEDKVSVTKIESYLVAKEAGEEEGRTFLETTTVYNAKGIGTIKNVNVNEYGTTTFVLKEVMSLDDYYKLQMP